MKKFSRSVLGVTLLEIMLVLAIAAMIIVMSVRYYQSATANQQATAMMQTVQAITVAMDSLSMSQGSYASITQANLEEMLPTNGFKSPWGSNLTLSGQGTNTYTVSATTAPSSAQVCALLKAQLTSDNGFNITCSAGSSFSYTYTR